MIAKKRMLERGRIRIYLSTPFIYMMIFPLIILDIFLELYHRITFRLYDIPLVIRSEYIKFDRYKLNYLGFMDKINNVQGKDIKAVAKKYLSLEPLVIKMLPETKDSVKK